MILKPKSRYFHVIKDIKNYKLSYKGTITKNYQIIRSNNELLVKPNRQANIAVQVHIGPPKVKSFEYKGDVKLYHYCN